MNKTLNLIDNFWTEFQDEKIKRLGLAHNSRGFCQCSTEQVIVRSKNPEEMRYFLMMGILIDQNIWNKTRSEFESVFRYPKLFSHPDSMGSEFPPTWFAENMVMRHKVNWNKVGEMFEIIFLDTKNWFMENNKINDFNIFKIFLLKTITSDFKDFPETVLLKHLSDTSLKNNL